MKGISTVVILILTVFLSMSALPAACDPVPPPCPVTPYMVTGYAYYANGTAANGAVVTFYMEGDMSKCVTTTVGSSGVSSAYYKRDVSGIVIIPADVGKSLIIEIDDGASNIGSGSLIITDLDAASHQVANITLVAPSGGGGSGGEGTYPPGWGETPTPAPTPDATVTPASTDTTEPSEPTVAEDDAVTPTEIATEDETDPKTPMKTDPNAPGFGAVFMIGGLLAAMYLVLRRSE